MYVHLFKYLKMESYVNMSNVTVDNSDLRSRAPYAIPTAVIIRSIGCVAFVLNTIALLYIIRLWKSQKRVNSFYIQLAFVCANDVGCGFVIILMSLHVYDAISVYVCGFSHIILNTLVCTSQGNIFFICLQRYIFARNIRAMALKWKSVLSKTLLAVNGLIGVVVLAINFLSSEFYTEFRGRDCSMAVFKNFGEQTVVILFAIGVPSLLASDVLCCLAIVKLSRSASVEPTDGSVTVTSRSSDQDELPGSKGFKKCQQRAITTVIVILIAFNLSTLPNCISIFLGFIDIRTDLTVGRLLLFCIFGNSLANPIIYITRVQSLRLMVKGDFVKLKQFLCPAR